MQHDKQIFANLFRRHYNSDIYESEVNNMEEWKVVPLEELEGRYEVSTYGRIRRVARISYLKDGRKRQLEEKIEKLGLLLIK